MPGGPQCWARVRVWGMALRGLSLEAYRRKFGKSMDLPTVGNRSSGAHASLQLAISSSSPRAFTILALHFDTGRCSMQGAVSLRSKLMKHEIPQKGVHGCLLVAQLPCCACMLKRRAPQCEPNCKSLAAGAHSAAQTELEKEGAHGFACRGDGFMKQVQVGVGILGSRRSGLGRKKEGPLVVGSTRPHWNLMTIHQVGHTLSPLLRPTAPHPLHNLHVRWWATLKQPGHLCPLLQRLSCSRSTVRNGAATAQTHGCRFSGTCDPVNQRRQSSGEAPPGSPWGPAASPGCRRVQR